MAAQDLPPEVKAIVVELSSKEALSSLALVWRDAWHPIRRARFSLIHLSFHPTIISALRQINSIIDGAPTIATHIRAIELGHFQDGYTPSPISMPEALSPTNGMHEGLATLITLASNATRLDIQDPDICVQVADAVAGEDVKCPELRRAIMASRISHVGLHQHMLTHGLSLLALFPCLSRIAFNNPHDNDGLFWGPISQESQQAILSPSDHRYSGVTVLSLYCVALKVVQQLDLASHFPNVVHLCFDTGEYRVWGWRNMMPVVRHVLPTFPKLRSLVIPDFSVARNEESIGPPLVFPPNIECLKLEAGRHDIESPAADHLEFLALSLLQHSSDLQKLTFLFKRKCHTYFDQRPVSSNSTIGCRQLLDEALAKKAECLVWEDYTCPCNYCRTHSKNEHDELCARVESSLEAKFPKVWRKFFAHLPKLERGGCVEGEDILYYRLSSRPCDPVDLPWRW